MKKKRYRRKEIKKKIKIKREKIQRNRTPKYGILTESLPRFGFLSSLFHLSLAIQPELRFPSYRNSSKQSASDLDLDPVRPFSVLFGRAVSSRGSTEKGRRNSRV